MIQPITYNLREKGDVIVTITSLVSRKWQNEPSLKWYCDILYENNSTENDDEDIANAACDCLEPDCREHILNKSDSFFLPSLLHYIHYTVKDCTKVKL